MRLFVLFTALFSPLLVHAQEPLASARWISAAQASSKVVAQGAPDGVAEAAPLPLFRRSFSVAPHAVRATLYVSGLGQCEAHLNGVNVTKDVLTPGWTDYRKRVFFNTYDVLALLKPGQNAIGVMLGNSMYNVPKTPGRYTKFTGTYGPLKLIAELDVVFADGTHTRVVSDGTWTTHAGPITFSNAYGGEDFDARLAPPGWDSAGFAEGSDWTKALETEGPGGVLVHETLPPIRVAETFPPVATTHPRAGVTVFDLGQNFAGWPEITATGPAGSTLKLTCGELLDGAGLATQRSDNVFPKAPNLFMFTLAGTGKPETWHPQFSYWGFRYVQVDTPSSETKDIAVTGQFVHASAPVIGHFTASIAPAVIAGQEPNAVSTPSLFNRIHALIDRAILSNMVSVLTDCPTREKLGWLEQTHLAASSIMYNYDVSALYRKSGDDMEDDQFPASSAKYAGLVPTLVPNFAHFADPDSSKPPGDFGDTPEWGSAVILSPWSAFQHYGDPAPLRAHYGSMQRYLAYLRGRRATNPDNIIAYGLGDWYDIGPGEPGRSKLTSLGITATGVYFQDLQAMSRMALLVGHPADATAYTREAEDVRKAFNAKFFHAETNQYDRGSQTANAFPLALGMVPEDRRAAVLANLVADIEAHGFHVTSGEIGFHYLVRALTDNGRSDVLYKMLSVTTSPSYGFQLTKGATALTEAWDTNPRSSQNHFMLGHAEEWFYRGLAGIDVDLSLAGAEQIHIRPFVPESPGETATAEASVITPLGLLASSWTRTGSKLRLEVTVPAKAAGAMLTMPVGFRNGIVESGHLVAKAKGVQGMGDGYTLRLAPGTYRFESSR